MKRNPTRQSLPKWTALAVPSAVLIGLLAVPSVQADYSSVVLGDNPAAYYRLNETGVTTVQDYATNSSTLGLPGYGLYSGAVQKHLAGPAAGGFAAGFTGGAAMTVDYNAALNPNPPFSIEFWVKPDATTALTCPFSATDFSVTPRLGWLVYIDGSSGTTLGLGAGAVQLRVYTTGGTAVNCNSIAGAITAGAWNHIAGVADASSVRLYVNGVLANTTTWSADFTPVFDKPVRVGVRHDAGFPLAGAAAHAAVYGTALSGSAVKAHFDAVTTNAAGYATQILADAPVGYWKLDEPAIAYPVAANTGTLGSAVNASYRYFSTTTLDLDSPTYPGFATTNTVLQTSGTNGRVNIPALNLNANTVTFECWIKRNGPQSSYAGVLFHRGSAGGTATGIDFQGVTDALGYHWSDQANTYNWYSGLVPPDGAWAYVALAVAPDQATMYLYDGTTWSSAANFVTHPVQAFADITRIGADQDGDRFFSGLIDEAAIYGQTLSEGQLRTHALAGFGDPAKSPPLFVTDPPTINPSGTIYSTTPFSLAADAYGEPPLTFQWRQEGTNVPGATSRVFSRASASAADGGGYDVIVSNNYGAVTSSIVTVTINPALPPTIDVQPASRQVYPDATARFSVAASGTTPISYQWKHAGTNLPGATNATLVVTDCTAAQAGAYQVGVTNVAGGLLSATANLSLFSPAAGSYEALVAGMKPVAYWRLGEATGTTAYDYSGGYDGTYVNVLQNQSGAVVGEANGAAGFDGGSSYITTGQPLLNNRAQFTVVGWIKRGEAHSGRGGYFGQNDLLEFGDAASGASIEAWINASGGNIISAWPWADNQWGLIVLTGNGTVGKLYLDGKLAGSLSSTVSSYGTNGYSFNIGGGGIFNDPAVNMDYFNGTIDEVAVFDRALGVQEICALYLEGTANVGAFEPSVTMITGSGEQGLTNVDFATTDGGFTVETPNGAPEAAWAFDGSTWYSAGQSTGFGTDNVSYLISPTNTVSQAGALRLTFTHRYSFERDTVNWDGGAIEVSINGGPWTYVPAAQFDQNGYTGTVGSAPSLAGKQAFIGNSPGHPAYITSSCLLASANPGDLVNIRFVADYDNNTTGNLTPPGWQISSVQIAQGLSGVVQVTCPCGSLEAKQGDLATGTWSDLGTDSVLISTSKTNQQYFRITR